MMIRNSTRLLTTCVALIATATLLLPAEARGQWTVPRTAHGHPDLQGNWTNATITPIERFTRVDEETILYEFTLDDPTTYTQTWGGALPFKRYDDLLYEYSCHEGNYAMSNILSGARYQERQAGGN